MEPDLADDFDHDPAVRSLDAPICFGVAVLEAKEQELGSEPREVPGARIHVAGNRSSRVVHEKVRKALAGLFDADARPPDLRQPILERGVAAVLLSGVRTGGR